MRDYLTEFSLEIRDPRRHVVIKDVVDCGGPTSCWFWGPPEVVRMALYFAALDGDD